MGNPGYPLLVPMVDHCPRINLLPRDPLPGATTRRQESELQMKWMEEYDDAISK